MSIDAPKFTLKIPEEDSRKRLVCDACGWIHYQNPKIVVGSVVTWQDQVLLCRRAIEPRKGFWTLPAGYLEEHETPEAGAMREAQEEACADIEINALLSVYSIPHISQVQLIYRAELAAPEFTAGPESEEVVLFAWDDIPQGELAFPSVSWALGHFQEARGHPVFVPFGNPEGETGLDEPQGL
jgi:ADP-ribose pyrophosphatase YjhB (NUDIX family)